MPGKKSFPRERILSAAIGQFSKVGYRGASTRDIARLAEVNEVTIFRHYTSKRELFKAAVEAELRSLTLENDLASQMAIAKDPNAAFCLVFDLVSGAIARRPNLVRLVQFSALEFGAEFEPLYRKYLGEWLQTSATDLQRWADAGELPGLDPQLIVLALAASVISLETLCVLLRNKALNEPDKSFKHEHAKIWHAVLGSAGTRR